MSTIGKALTLLDVLSRIDNEAGLTEIAQACGYDKATTRRFLVELEKHGFVEQLPETRKYRIGAAPLRLARVREARYPFLRTALPFIRQLAERTGETVHLSEFSNGRLCSIHVEESAHAHRVIVNVGTTLHPALPFWRPAPIRRSRPSSPRRWRRIQNSPWSIPPYCAGG